MENVALFELSVEFKARFQQALDERDDEFIAGSLAAVNPADISALLEEFETEECKYVLGLMPKEIGAKILQDLEKDIRKDFLTTFEKQELAVFITLLDSDDGTDILYEMPVRDRNEVIRHIEDEEKASNLMELLEYDEDVAGGLMAKELIKAKLDWDILRCIEEIRKQAESVEKIYSVYVVDEQENLVGKVAVKNLILARSDAKVADVFDEDLISVDTSATEDEVVDAMQKYDLVAIPVVNARGKLVGRITIDDVVDIIRETAEEEKQLMTGVSSGVEEEDSAWRISRSRLPWLIIGMTGGLLAAQFMGLFEEEMIAIPALAFFIPLITASSGNVGIQSSAIVVQSLASPNVFASSMMSRLIKVFYVAMINGAILSAMVFGSVMLFMGEQALAVTVAAALFSVVLLASFMGTVTPLVLNKFGINPAVASGPFITTTNDLLGLAVYFSVAHLLYHL